MISGKLPMKNLITYEKVNSIHYQAKNIRKEDEIESNDSIKCSRCLENFRTVVAKKRHEKFFHLFSKPFICECGQQFGKVCELNYHVRRVHNKEKNYVCNVCKKAFFKPSDLKIHHNIHETSPKFICEDCGRNFKHVSNLIRHSRIHTGVKPYLCLPCNKRFSQVTALRQHEVTEKHKEKVVQENENKDSYHLFSAKSGNVLTDKLECNMKTGIEKRKWWFYCKICGERFPFSILLRDHETKHMANKDIKCNSCKAEFSLIKDFNNHACKSSSDIVKRTNEIEEKKAQEISTVKNYESNFMGDKSKDVTDRRIELTLAQNGQIILDNNEVLLTLNDKVYGLVLINNDVTVVDSDECLLTLNKNLAETDGEPEFPITGNIFSLENIQDEVSHNRNNGVDHLVLPENWLWSEEECPLEKKSDPSVVFEEAQERTRDLVNRKQIEGEPQKTESSKKDKTIADNRKRKHRCPECKKEFSWNSSLRSHIIRKHTKKKEYSCMKCQKTYYSKLLVDHHIKRDHLNIRSYKCTECGKAFFRRYDLKVHIRIHTDERPYICGVCGKRFRHLSHSIRHDKSHLKESPSEQNIKAEIMI